MPQTSIPQQNDTNTCSQKFHLSPLHCQLLLLPFCLTFALTIKLVSIITPTLSKHAHIHVKLFSLHIYQYYITTK